MAKPGEKIRTGISANVELLSALMRRLLPRQILPGMADHLITQRLSGQLRLAALTIGDWVKDEKKPPFVIGGLP